MLERFKIPITTDIKTLTFTDDQQRFFTKLQLASAIVKTKYLLTFAKVVLIRN